MSDPPENKPPNHNVVKLGTEVQKAIADGLRKWYQHIIDEGVPDHLTDLIDQLSTENHSKGRPNEERSGQDNDKKDNDKKDDD